MSGCDGTEPGSSSGNGSDASRTQAQQNEPEDSAVEKRTPEELARLKLACANNLRQIGTLLIVSRMEKDRWPHRSGSEFLLSMCLDEPRVRSHPEIFVCPADGSIDPGSEEWRRKFASLRSDLGTWPDGLTSYAGRNIRDFPLVPYAETARTIACDSSAHHADGVCVLTEDGKVEFFTWKRLGISSASDFELGPDGPALLRSLCVRPRKKD